MTRLSWKFILTEILYWTEFLGATCQYASPGVGVTKAISSVPLFSEIFSIVKTQVSSCISRSYLAIQTWFKYSKRYFCQIEKFACGEINERSFSYPHPWFAYCTSKDLCTYSRFVVFRHWSILPIALSAFDTLRPRQHGRHFADDTFKRIFLNENVIISIKISLKFVPKGPINNIPALVQIMAWHRPVDKPLSEAMMVSLTTHTCVTRPEWFINWHCGNYRPTFF